MCVNLGHADFGKLVNTTYLLIGYDRKEGEEEDVQYHN